MGPASTLPVTRLVKCYAEEGQARVWHRVYQAANQVLALGFYREVFAAERDDAQTRLSAHHSRHLIGLQSGTVDDVPRGNLSARGLHVHLPVAPRNAVNSSVEEQVAAVLAELGGIRLRHLLEVDYARVGREDRLNPGRIRLKFGKPLFADHLQAFCAIGGASLVQVLQARHFVVVDSDDDLAAHLVLDVALVAELAQQPAAG